MSESPLSGEDPQTHGGAPPQKPTQPPFPARSGVVGRPSSRSDYAVLSWQLAPTDEEIRSMINQLTRALGSMGNVSTVLTTPQRTLTCWLSGKRKPNDAARKLIWVVYALLLQPQSLRTLGDLLTWGRFTFNRRPMRRPTVRTGSLLPPNDGSDWVI